MRNIFFLEKRLGIVSPLHFYMILQEKCFLCYVILTEQI